jgi:hypothetical protein
MVLNSAKIVRLQRNGSKKSAMKKKLILLNLIFHL